MQAHFHGNFGSYKIKDVMIWVFLPVMRFHTWNAEADLAKNAEGQDRERAGIHVSVVKAQEFEMCSKRKSYQPSWKDRSL